MTDPYIEPRLARIEAVQTDLSTRLSRVESQAGTAPAEALTRSHDNAKWMRIGIAVLVMLAVVWFIDEMPGPAIWDRLF